VAVQLVGKHIDSTVNNPIEAESALARRQAAPAVRVGQGQACPTRTKLTATQSWADIAHLQASAGIPVDYVMLRGIFMAPGRHARPDASTTSTCSRRCVHCPSGRSSWTRARSTRPVNALFFVMFEVWFKVPLYKGALNPLGFLGY
jgi:hypothetical protein